MSNFSAKSEILSAIAKTESPEMKTVLLLLLGVFEEIGGKIDAVLSNERALRQTVLNGHEPVHHEHHEWIARKMQEEKDSNEDSRKIKAGVLQSVISHVALLLLGGLLAYLGLK